MYQRNGRSSTDFLNCTAHPQMKLCQNDHLQQFPPDLVILFHSRSRMLCSTLTISIGHKVLASEESTPSSTKTSGLIIPYQQIDLLNQVRICRIVLNKFPAARFRCANENKTRSDTWNNVTRVGMRWSYLESGDSRWFQTNGFLESKQNKNEVDILHFHSFWICCNSNIEGNEDFLSSQGQCADE